jgi:NADH dehydrogenase (ubiquinone) 1 beta subcomplex subunit 5
MVIKPTEFAWRKFKDFVHLYTCVAVIPIFLFASYCNIFIGHAELAETPEGYEPEFYEYSKGPVTRLIAKYLFEHPAANHERLLHVLESLHEKQLLKKVEQDVKMVMAARSDQRSWTFEWFDFHESRRYREDHFRQQDNFGVGRANEAAGISDPRDWSGNKDL